MYNIVPIRTVGPNIINYCYLVYDAKTRKGILIDPGWEFHLINSKIDALDIDLKGILLTHHHKDHARLAEEFAIKNVCPVYISKVEAEFYEFSCTYLSFILTEDFFYLDQFKIKPLFTPGHTVGSFCFLIDSNLFTGDTLFAEGCGNCVDKGADPEELFDSLNKLKSKIDQDTKIFPGHSFGIPIGKLFSEIRKKNIYLQIESKELFIKYRLRKIKASSYQYI